MSSSQPRFGSRCLVYTQSTMGSDLSQPTSTSYTLYRIFTKYTLYRIIPLASFLLLKSFYVLCLCFQLPTINLYQSNALLPDAAQYVTCASIRELFPQRYFQSGPPTLCVGLFCLYVMF